jgi:hypothetical protein
MTTQTQTAGSGNGHDTTINPGTANATAGTTLGRGTRGTVTTSDDTTAIVKIGKLLDGLETTARSRVVRFIAEKYEAELNS